MSNKDNMLQKGQKVAKLATLATILLSLLKALIGILSGSVLLVADAIHSAIDVIAIFSSWFGLKISQKKYNENFPYGYYKAENFATLIASFFIFYASYEIFIKSYEKFFETPSLKLPVVALIVPLVSALVSYFIAVYERKIGEEINSQSLIANAQESKMDVISSLVVFGGIFLSYFNVAYIESIIGIGLSVMIFKIGYQNIKIAVYSLMDANLDKELEQKVKQLVLKVENVKEVSDLKLRQSGIFVFGELSIKMMGNINVKRAHDIADLIENKVKKKFPEIESLFVHIEPYNSDLIRISIPVGDNNGINSKIVNNFGRAKYFLFVDIKNKKVISHYIKENIYIDKEARAGLSSSKIVLGEGVNIVLTKKIGEISFHTLRDNFVDIYAIKSNDVNRVINDFLEGRLKKINKAISLKDK